VLRLFPLLGARFAAMSSTPSSVLNFAQATPTGGSASLSFVPLDASALAAAPQVVVVGTGSDLAATIAGLSLSASTALTAALVGGDQAKAGDSGKVVTTWLSGSSPMQHLSLVLLPESASRHNHPARPDALPKLLKSAMSAAGSSGASKTNSSSACFPSQRNFP
jgi:apolipoprotein N-acyltransferase